MSLPDNSTLEANETSIATNATKMSLKSYQSTVANRFMHYVQIDTQSDPKSHTQPSTEKQKDLSRVLVEELKTMGITDAKLDEYGYVYATIPSTIEKDVPTICYCAHVDTSPDCSGTNVKPILHKQWNGSPIVLPDDTSVVITTENHPYLLQRIGDDIITASGTTLLGADDKAGVAIIMDTAAFLMQNPQVPHGRIRILFTPDEEIGRGVNAVNMEELDADFGYTLDGGDRGHIEDETFSADAVILTFHGISAHPGYAKGNLINSTKIAAEFLAALPQDSWSPETTSGKEGFVHPVSIEGKAEKTVVQFIIRDFETENLKKHEDRLKQIAEEIIAKYKGTKLDFVVVEQYRNMKDVLDQHPHVVAYAQKAYERADMKPILESIRGGTDGSRLSFMGLPCPNIFTGEMAFHSKEEYVSVQDMQKAVEVCVHLAQIVTEDKEA